MIIFPFECIVISSIWCIVATSQHLISKLTLDCECLSVMWNDANPHLISHDSLSPVTQFLVVTLCVCVVFVCQYIHSLLPTSSVLTNQIKLLLFTNSNLMVTSTGMKE